MATTILNTRQLFTISTTAGELTLAGQVKLDANNSVIGINAQINHSLRGNIGSFTIGDINIDSISAQSPQRGSLNVNNTSDFSSCSAAVETMLTELAAQYPTT